MKRLVLAAVFASALFLSSCMTYTCPTYLKAPVDEVEEREDRARV